MITEWRTTTFAQLETKLSTVIGKTTPFEPLKISTVGDLMMHLPRRYMDGTELSDLGALTEGEEVAVVAEVLDTKAYNLDDGGGYGSARKPRLEATITDRKGRLKLAFFGKPHLIKHWQQVLQPGARGIFAGKVREFNRSLQLAHPDFVIIDESGAVIAGARRNEDLAKVTGTRLVGLYPQAGKLRTWTIAATIGTVLDFLAGLEDPLPKKLRLEAGVIGLLEAFHAVHRPETKADAAIGFRRLRFDEAFSLQLTMARRRADARSHGATPRPRRDGGILDAFDERLPYQLTHGQTDVSDVIMGELAQPYPMQRLLQGEVGSGKTVVALRAMLAVIDAGGQAALLAPTEVLAGQHYQTITKLLGDLGHGGGLLAGASGGTDVALITGSMTAAQKRDAMLRAASGEAGIVIGTHALLGERIQFADLGLVVIDEQHRFGVEQRAALTAKAELRPHVLVLTATPIPRTVAMTVFGDLEVSTLTEVPAGRADVSTVVVDARARPAWVDRAWQRVVEEAKVGRQAFIVCARIYGETPGSGKAKKDAVRSGEDLPTPEDAEPAIAAEDLYAELTAGPLRDLRVGLLHGQQPADVKDGTMRDFAAGDLDVLVSTTVIEVGVDVPNASVMVICDADRFGISQLHQLRGRIGRGEHPGVCLLLTRTPEDSLARDRLEVVSETRDGFELAQADLEQRREGDVLGASQSGSKSSLRLLRVLDDGSLIERARQLAERELAKDPELTNPGLSDIVAQVEHRAAGDWLERT
ncbi:ATP-dependent DNA helicase RecG [Microlunatus speluncae]|uniref:ATP-dependent DNA helicase RecG n=1 Tax=Microlunatus speluncae TaxID=2594267 RepID=UPI00126672FC|nr:ATP-dependent DNA helicase RecG [Microlunatus speluncae]